MDKLTESLIKHLCPTCQGKCDKGLVIIKTKDTIELHCPDYKPDKEKIKRTSLNCKIDINKKKNTIARLML